MWSQNVYHGVQRLSGHGDNIATHYEIPVEKESASRGPTLITWRGKTNESSTAPSGEVLQLLKERV